MELHGERKNAWKSVLVLSAIMLAFLIGDFLKEEVFFSETENRILASKPEISKEAVLSGEYMEDYEAYVNDQFVSRNTWIMLKTRMDILLQKKEINGVYLAADDYLIEQHLPEDYPQETIDKKLDLLDNLVQAYPQTRVMLVPTADNILTDKLPDFAPYFDQRAFLQQVKDRIGEERVIDVFPTLEEHAQEEIYYRTDHHWTTRGAYYAYREWCRYYVDFPMWYQLEKLETVTEDFQGSLQSKLNLPVEGEKIQILPHTKVHDVKITYDFGKTTDSFYEESYLEGKNKYGYFLDDNHGLVEIECDTNSEDVLFIIKDSYANTLIPMLAPHYKKIYVVDLRYFNGKLLNFMASCNEDGKMQVLVLYNCIHFLEDFLYF